MLSCQDDKYSLLTISVEVQLEENKKKKSYCLQQQLKGVIVVNRWVGGAAGEGRGFIFWTKASNIFSSDTKCLSLGFLRCF